MVSLIWFNVIRHTGSAGAFSCGPVLPLVMLFGSLLFEILYVFGIVVLFFRFDGYFFKALSLPGKKSPEVRVEKIVNRFYVLGK
jgi:hypothetical protein